MRTASTAAALQKLVLALVIILICIVLLFFSVLHPPTDSSQDMMCLRQRKNGCCSARSGLWAGSPSCDRCPKALQSSAGGPKSPKADTSWHTLQPPAALPAAVKYLLFPTGTDKVVFMKKLQVHWCFPVKCSFMRKPRMIQWSTWRCRMH